MGRYSGRSFYKSWSYYCWEFTQNISLLSCKEHVPTSGSPWIKETSFGASFEANFMVWSHPELKPSLYISPPSSGGTWAGVLPLLAHIPRFLSTSSLQSSLSGFWHVSLAEWAAAKGSSAGSGHSLWKSTVKSRLDGQEALGHEDGELPELFVSLVMQRISSGIWNRFKISLLTHFL